MLLSLVVTLDHDSQKIQLHSISVPGSKGWTRRSAKKNPGGIDALAVLTLKTALHKSDDKGRFELDGLVGSLADRLYSAFHEKLTWPANVFGSAEGFRSYVGKTSTQGRYVVWLNDPQNDPLKIVINLNTDDVSDDREKLLRILSDITNERRLSTTLRPIRLATLGSAKLAYISDAYDGFRTRLRELGVELDPARPFEKFGESEDSPSTEQGRKQWQNYVEYLLGRLGGKQPDYWIAAGSQAAMALRAYYGESFGVPPNCPPVIFLGVTYPVALHIVDCLKNRCESREVCGVSYGADGLRSIISMIYHRIQPGCRMRFIYFKDFPQDVEAAEQLRRTRLFDEKKLEIVEATWHSLPDCIRETDIVYVSWFTFESIFEDPTDRARSLVDTLKTRKVVATTHLNCRDGYAFAACCADDQEIGRLGAELLYGHLSGEIPRLGHHDVIVPSIQCWINRSQADACGISGFPTDLSPTGSYQ